MKKYIVLFFGLFLPFLLFGQGDFLLENNASKATIPFKLINNLIFIPVAIVPIIHDLFILFKKKH